MTGLRRPSIRSYAVHWIVMVLLLVQGSTGAYFLYHQWGTSLFMARTQAASILAPLSTLTAIALSVNDVEGVDDYIDKVTNASPDTLPIVNIAVYNARGDR